MKLFKNHLNKRWRLGDKRGAEKRKTETRIARFWILFCWNAICFSLLFLSFFLVILSLSLRRFATRGEYQAFEKREKLCLDLHKSLLSWAEIFFLFAVLFALFCDWGRFPSTPAVSRFFPSIYVEPAKWTNQVRERFSLNNFPWSEMFARQSVTTTGNWLRSEERQRTKKTT